MNWLQDRRGNFSRVAYAQVSALLKGILPVDIRRVHKVGMHTL